MTKYLTPEGLEKLKKELNRLKTIERKKIAAQLKHAISFGDLSENFAYHEAKESQAFLEGKILEIEETIRNAEVVKKRKGAKYIQVGSIVLLGLENKKEEFQIVGAAEANPLEGKISCESPLGKELLGKLVGDRLKIRTPKGKAQYNVLRIH